MPDPAASTPPAARRCGVKRSILLVLSLLGAAALGHTYYLGSHVDPHVYTAAELESGPVTQIVSWDADHTAVQVSRLTDLPADHLWRVVTDQGSFDKYMPFVTKTTVEPGPDGTIIEKQVLDLPHATFDLVLSIRLTEKPGERKAGWRQTQGELAFNEGAWIVEAAGAKSILRYQIAAAIRWCPQWAVNHAMRKRLGRIVEAVERRVRDLERTDPGYFEKKPGAGS